MLKEAADTELLQAIRLAAEDEIYLNPRLGAQLARESADTGRPDRLTEREVEILGRIALRHTNAEIASDLHLSVRPVEAHRGHIQQKICRTGRAEMVHYALEHGLVDLRH